MRPVSIESTLLLFLLIQNFLESSDIFFLLAVFSTFSKKNRPILLASTKALKALKTLNQIESKFL